MANRLYNKQVSPKGYKAGGMARKKEKKMGGDNLKPQSQQKFRGRPQPKGARRLRGVNLSDFGFKKVGDVDIVDFGLESKKKMGGGRIKKKMGGSLKPVDPKTQKGLSKLPTKVRNKMGYMKKGGKVHGK